MQERYTIDIFFNLGGQGFEAATAPTLTITTSYDSAGESASISMEAAKFATSEFEIYTLDQFQPAAPSGTLGGVLQFDLGNTENIFAGSLTIQNEGTAMLSGRSGQTDFYIVDQTGSTNGMSTPITTYPTLTASFDAALDFSIGYTETILASSLTYQNEGTIQRSGGATDRLDFSIVDQYGYSIISVPEESYSSANIQGASGSTPTVEIGYLPIMGGATIINPAQTQPIYQSYGASGTKTTEFQIDVLNSQGSTFAITPTATVPGGEIILTAATDLLISQGAVNDGSGIFGTYVVPKVFTYPDGSTIPSQRQTWTI